MSTAEQLLAAIREHPDEDTPRLVYADYCEENDQPERAEFIRVQCEYAHVPKWELRSKQLRQRIRILLARHGRTWSAELPTLTDVTWGAYRRGFVSSVRVPSGKVLAEHAEAIREAAPIDRVEFTTTEVSSGRKKKSLSWIREISLAEREDFEPDQFKRCLDAMPPTLRVLDLSGTGIENAGATAIANAPHLTNLEELDLSNCFIGVQGVTDLCGAKHLASLRIVRFSSYGSGYVEDPFLNTEGVEVLAAPDSQLRNLTTLELGQNELGDSAVHALLTSPTFAKLEHVGLRWCGMPETAFNVKAGPARWKSLDISGHRPTPESVRHMAALPQLSSLLRFRANGCNLKAEHLSILSEAKFAPELRELSLQQNGCGPDGIAALAKGNWPNLHALHLTRNATGDGIQHLAAGQFPVLTELRLGNNEIGDAGVTTIANAEWANSLRHLWLDRNQIQLAGAKALASSPRLRNLTELHLEANGIDVKKEATNGRKAQTERVTFGTAGAEALATGDWPELTDLDLKDAKCGDAGLKALAAAGILDRLLHLDIERNDLTPEGVRALAERECPYLRELHLGYNQQLGAESLTILGEATGFPALTALRLTCCNLEAAPLEEFANSKLVAQLRRLRISGNKSSQALEKLTRSLNYGYPSADRFPEETNQEDTW